MKAYILRRMLWIPVVLLVVSLRDLCPRQLRAWRPRVRSRGSAPGPRCHRPHQRTARPRRPLLRTVWALRMETPCRETSERVSPSRGERVSSLITGKIWVSAQLGIAAMIISVFGGVPLGLTAALNQGRWMDPVIVATTLLICLGPRPGDRAPARPHICRMAGHIAQRRLGRLL